MRDDDPGNALVYMDHAATTPLAAEVADAMAPWLSAGSVGNASSVHAIGRRARSAVEDARDRVAAALGVPALEVIFTAGGTEADNQAVKGLALAGGPAGHLVTTAIEHHAVGDAVGWLVSQQGYEATVVAPGADGIVPAEAVLDAVRPSTTVVSVMAANNEIGTLQPVADLGPALAAQGIAFHVDAVQAIGRIRLPEDLWQATSVAFSAHKFGGPTGVGVLVLRRDAAVDPLLHGGGQERGIRSGTLNVAGIVGLGVAAERATSVGLDAMDGVAALRDRLAAGLMQLDDVACNGHATTRLPNNLHVAVGGCDGEAMLLGLDRAGIACSTGSACQSGATTRSHVLDAIGARQDAAHLRFTLGESSSAAEVDRVIDAVAGLVGRLRSTRRTAQVS